MRLDVPKYGVKYDCGIDHRSDWLGCDEHNLWISIYVWDIDGSVTVL